MSSTTIAHRFLAGETLTAVERRDLMHVARRLRAASGDPVHALAGRHVAVAIPTTGEVLPLPCFEEAAVALGAHVSHIAEDALEAACSNAEWARMLGRLYDAVDCGRLARDAALGLEKDSGIAMFTGLGETVHPLRQLLAELSDEGQLGDEAERETLLPLIEAVLLATLT